MEAPKLFWTDVLAYISTMTYCIGDNCNQANPDLSVTTLTMPQLSSISVNKQLVKGTLAVCATKIIFTKLPKCTII